MTTALVVIDVQEIMFALPEGQPYDGKNVVRRIAGLVETARASGTPVFYVQHDGGPESGFAQGMAKFSICPEISPHEGDDVTVKRKCNAFQDTDFDQKLKRAKVDHLVVCGMQSEFCVDTAVRAAVDRGYKITLVSDAHSTFDTPVARAKDIIAHENRTLGSEFAQLKQATEVRF